MTCRTVSCLPGEDTRRAGRVEGRCCRRNPWASAALLLIGMPVGAQAPLQIEVELVATPQAEGPRAWRYVRELLASPRGLDPRAALRMTWRNDRIEIDAGQQPTLGAYLRATVQCGDGRIQIACDHDGHEAWRVSGEASTHESYRALLDWLDVARGNHTRAWFDTGALVGLLSTGFETESPHGAQLAIAAAECGELLVAREPRVHGEGLRARSHGGLLLPAALLWLTQRHPTADTPERRFTRLAFAARDARRDEAVMQLARFTSPDSERSLRALCQHDGTALRAMESLARRGAADSLPQLAGIASSQDAVTREIATAAINTLWPRASAAQRTRTLSRANHRVQAALRELDRVALATMPGGPEARDETPTDGAASLTRRSLAAGLLFTAGLLAILLARRGRSLPPQ